MTEPILVVIPCLNEEAFLEKLAEGLLTSNRDLPLRLVIADGGSTDRTIMIAQSLARRYGNVLVMENPKRIQAAGINLAVATHGSDAVFLIRIDAHAEYPGDYIRTLVDEAQKTRAASIVVAMRTGGISSFQRAVAAAQNSKLGNGGSAHRNTTDNGAWVDHGHHALIRIDAFRAIGGYDESFSHNEDAEFDLRLAKAGFRIWLTSKTSLTYFPRDEPVALFLQYMKHGFGRARTIQKHRIVPKLRQLAPAAVLPAALLALLSPWCGIFIMPLAVWVLFCLGYGAYLGLEANDKKLALAGPVAMVMHAGWSVGFWRAMAEHFWKAS